MAAALPRFTYNSIDIDINTPLKENNGFERRGKRSITYSNSGIQQTSFDYNELTFDVKLTFITSSIRDNILSMWDDWACEGKVITFYPDYTNSPGTSYSCTIISDKLEPKRTAPGMDYWDINFTIRKVIS